MDKTVTAILVFLASLAIVLILGQISEGGILTGQFYLGDNTSALEEEYNSINWNKSAEEGYPSGSVHLDSFKELNSTKMNINNQSLNTSSKKALLIESQKNKSLKISFSKEVAGLDERNLTLSNGSDAKFRFRDNISMTIEKGNKTFTKKLRVRLPENDSNVSSANKTTENKTETVIPTLTLSANISTEINSNQIELINPRNHTKTLEMPENSSFNQSRYKIGSNSTLMFNKSSDNKMNISTINRTRYIIEFSGNREKNDPLDDTGNTSEYELNKPTKENGTVVRNETEEDNSTENVNQKTDYTNQNTTEGTTKENTTEEVSNDTLPEKGGEWVKIQSEKLEDFYIFKYEASRKDANSTNKGESNTPYSQKGVIPWNEISQEKAKQICQSLGDGYSLPSNEQWHAAASQSDHGKIRGNIRGGDKSSSKACRTYQDGRIDDICLTGTGPESWQNSANLVDIKGNLWEWTSTVVNTENLEKSGESGYITSFGEDLLNPGLSDQQEGIDNSYYYSSSEGKKAIRRGGGWNSKRLSGLYSTIIDRNPQYSSTAIGFRCVYER